jgi:hypothetical protein
MASRKRRDDETFEKYRENLKIEDKALRRSYTGMVVWASTEMGTYRKSVRQ